MPKKLNQSSNIKIVEELFKAKAHLGHKSSRVHPRAKKYIYKTENSVSIIDLTKTAELLKTAKEFVSQLLHNSKIIVFVATKRIAASEVQKICQANSIPHISTKWPAGLLTNFETIEKNIKKLKMMLEEKTNGKWLNLPKREINLKEKQLTKLDKNYGGVTQLVKHPDALFIIDVKKEKNAFIEAKKIGIPVVAIVDTNVDPTNIDYPIPANDDSLSSVEYIVNHIIEGHAMGEKNDV